MASLLVFGGTGKLGGHLLAQALKAGHQVTAFVRSPGKLTLPHPNLRLIAGEIFESASVDGAFEKPPFGGPYDAVVSALGIYQKEPGTLLTDGTKPFLAAMQRHGVKRLLVVSSVGAGETWGTGPFWVRAVQRFILKNTLADKTQQEAAIRASGLDWTLIRPPMLTDKAAGGSILTWEGPKPADGRPTWQVSRADVAAELLRALADPQTIRRAYQISNRA